ncbi:prolyl oligopeptidase family serine peptidase [Oscillochloris sp. ZM17-4]|uniref:alpha/beta hydrolase family protein n=1 Tax=Oscillochloris sp. ZM17-4 TaxID=2866714 RepID=UPI001C73654C|nr:prolyl oligopeptidase family serine peptidase [Oscillochloris sp. ZM17-4]MBX0329856.1 prolyl oligopeptidase family serine peptidase [Oscillochloris sp. ZM17-4]
MRPFRWLPVLLASVLLLGVAPALAQDSKTTTKNNIVTVQPTRRDEDLPTVLGEEDVAKIDRLQSDLVVTVPSSPVSPDDQVVFVTSGDQLGFLNINDGSTVELPADDLGPFLPLPLLGISQFTWLDNETLGTLALNFAATTQDETLVLLGINRDTLELSGDYVTIPQDLGIVSVSPDLMHFLVVLVPPDAMSSGGTAAMLKTTKVQIGMPQVEVASRAETPRLPRTLQARAAQARTQFAGLLDRFKLMQDTPPLDTSVTVTEKTLDILTYNAQTGERSYVTTVPEATGLFGEAWTPDSSRLAISFYSLRQPDDPRPVYDGALISEIFYRDSTGNIPPAENPLLQNNNTYTIDVNSHEVKILRAAGPGAPPMLAAEAWSPDGATLLVKALYPAKLKGRSYPIYTPQFSERASYRFYNSDMQMTGELNTNILSSGSFSEGTALFVSPDEVIFRGVVGSDRHPYYYNRVSGELRNLGDRAGLFGAFVSTHSSRQIVLVYQSFTSPPDVYRLGWDGKGFSRLTWMNEELRQYANLRQDPVSFKLRSGVTRVGTLIQPADATFPPKNKPLIVWQEGGPGPAMFNSWATNVENPYSLLPTFGFPVLVVPLAGRPGYTPASFNSLVDNSNFGQIDIDEQAEIVGQMVARGWTNKAKVGIVGCSYAGYFTWQSVIRHPDTYAAANPQCSLVDLITEWTRGYDALAPYMEGLPPYNNNAEYRNDSPAYNVAKVKAAVLSFQGSEDFLPVVQGENMHLQLYNAGKNAKMLKFMGEGHGLQDPKNQLYAAQQQLDWFRTYLKP